MYVGKTSMRRMSLSVTDRLTTVWPQISELGRNAVGPSGRCALHMKKPRFLRRLAAEEARVLKAPAPLIKVESLGDSSVDILFRVWTLHTDWWDTKLDLLHRCKVALEEGGCSIPFPQRDVHLFNETAPQAARG
jgi:hypothetical protein